MTTTANVGGLGLGALISGLLAEYAAGPLTVPFVVFTVLLSLALIEVLVAPDVRPRPDPTRPYRPPRGSPRASAVVRQRGGNSGRGRASTRDGTTGIIIRFSLCGPFVRPG